MLLYVAVGSALGGVSRYLLGGFIQRLLDTAYPAGTLFINISGSFLVGAFLRYAVETPTLSPESKAFLAIGFCGGYTTFSTFSYETLVMLRTGEWSRAGAYVVSSVLLSLLGTFLGFALARQVIAFRQQL